MPAPLPQQPSNEEAVEPVNRYLFFFTESECSKTIQ